MFFHKMVLPSVPGDNLLVYYRQRKLTALARAYSIDGTT